MTHTTKQKKKIPKFKSYEEEAEFWDTHNIREYDEFETVELEVDKTLAQTLTIRLNAETLSKLRKRAEKKGLGVTTFIRMSIREHLEELEKKEQEEQEEREKQRQYPAHP
jgi:predicted DNA binding CopG/RHH family protein